jgi:hypothetical protein
MVHPTELLIRLIKQAAARRLKDDAILTKLSRKHVYKPSTKTSP